MKAVLFCNHVEALNILMRLESENALAAVCLPVIGKPDLLDIEVYCKVRQIPLLSYTHQAGRALDVQADYGLVFTFPHIFSQSWIDLFPRGMWNFHASNLPHYRGPDPIFWQITKGEASCGLSLHQLTDKVDEGPVLLKDEVALNGLDIKGSVFSKIAQLAVEMLPPLQRFLSSGEAVLDDQSSEGTYYPRPSHDDLEIDWQAMTASQVGALIRAANPDYSGAVTRFRGVELRIFEIDQVTLSEPVQAPAGVVIEFQGDPHVYVTCAEQSVVRLNVVASASAMVSGTRMKALYGVQAGELLGKQLAFAK